MFFWEPGYLRLTRFLRRVVCRDPQVRAQSVIVAGTYEGDRFGIERDVARALRRLRTDSLDVFLLFWTRSQERLSDEALDCLRALKQRGVIRAFGLSTHLRDLAELAIESGNWDVIMTRHSAAHPGAESRLLPLAQQHGVGILTFSALCYGRMLKAMPPEPGAAAAPDAGGIEARASLPTATECYRYSLSQPGVSACWSAPRRRSELSENLEVLTQPALDTASQERLRAHGRKVHAHNRQFDALLRKGHEGNQEPQPALLALLEASAGSEPVLDGERPEASAAALVRVPS